MTATNTAGSYRTGAGNGVDLKPIAGTSDQYRVSDAVAGEWIEYTVNVATAGTYVVEFRVGHRDPGSTFHLESHRPGVAAVNLTGSVGVPDTNSFDAFTTVSRTVSLEAGFRCCVSRSTQAWGGTPRRWTGCASRPRD